MNIDINKLSAVLFSSKKNSEFIHQLNVALRALIQRDNQFISYNGSAPQLWECKWLNQPDKIAGYPKGYTVWMNTNSYESLLQTNFKTIESYVQNNSTLNQMYQSINSRDTAAVNEFLINAAKGTASPKVSAIYCLGDMSQKTQIRVSTIDNNKSYPTDLCCWKDFFTGKSYDENVSILLSSAEDTMQRTIEEHLSSYHMLGVTSADLQVSGFFKKNPFNADNVDTQSFFDHNYCNEMNGFDFVKQWKMLPDGSAWCKVWNSGYVEQGGFVDNIPGEALIPVEFMTTYNYPVGPAFYQKEYQSYNNQYSIDNPLQANNRYMVTVTPILDVNSDQPYPDSPMNVGNELVYSSTDVTNMSNHGFAIVNTDIGRERYSKYSWHACGYKIISYPSQMFDNSTTKTTASTDAFSIDTNGNLITFENDSYALVVVPENVITISNGVFEGCTNVQTFVLPKSLTGIGSRAFYNCSSIHGIVIPDNVKQISQQAFAECQHLAYVKMGNTLNNIGPSAFYNDASLATISRFNDEDPSHTFDKVGDYAFYNTNAKTLNLSLRSAGIDNFWGDYCFAENKSLEEVNILSACYMSTHMFGGCTNLKTVNFKNSHTSYVYPNVFDGCSSLTGITLPSKIWYISEEMFKDCSSLKYVKFDDYSAANSMINLIQKNAFNGCKSMQSLELPASLTSIEQLDDACLCGCSLTSITFNGIDKSSLTAPNGNVIDNVLSSGMFRLRHNCTIKCKNNETIKFTYDASREITYIAPLDYALSVDRNTTSNFRIAEWLNSNNKFWWYYNASQLCAQAYTDNRPCVFIYSLLGCKPCQIYVEKIFNNPDFQNWARKQKFYLCGMEVNKQPSYDTQLAFCTNKLVPSCKNFAKEDQGQTLEDVVPNALGNKYRRWRVDSTLLNSNLTTPVIVFYYNNGSNATAFAHTFHNIDKEISLWGLNGVIQCFKSLCLYYFDNNQTSNAKFVVDAVKPFDIADYPSILEQKTQNDYIVTPTNSAGKALTSIEDVNADIVARIPANDSTGDVPYLMNCNFQDIDYLVNTFSEIDTCMTISEVNALVNSGDNAKYKFKIGNYYYKFSLSTTETKQITVCSPQPAVAGAPVWTKTS